VELEVEPPPPRAVLVPVEALEPGVVGVDALERELQPEAPRQRPGEGRLSGADHAGDA